MTEPARNYCPPEFEQRITEAGGLNRYDQPNFRIAWGQTETTRVAGHGGYKNRLVGLDEPCWMLMQWQPPSKYGLASLFYLDNYDAETHLQMLGGFPYSGKYEILQPFISKEIRNGRPHISFLPLCNYMIDFIVPIIKLAREVSLLRQKAFIAEQEARRNRKDVERIEAMLHDAHYGLREARSGGYLAAKSELQRRVEAIERRWNEAIRFFRSHPRGLQTN